MSEEIKHKKRGRKPKKVIVDDEPVKIPKKRGRKPKVKLDTDVKKPPPKKRGRKPKDKFGSINEKNNVSQENIIIHLPLQNIDKELLNETIITNPKPYENSSNTFYSDFVNEIKTEPKQSKEKLEDRLNDIIIERKNEISCKTHDNSNIFIEFIEYNKQKKWPSSTNIDCLWDTCSFNTQPYGIPIKKINNTYYMFGNFCCPECAAAYIFEMNDDSNIWERYSLLNYLYNDNKPIFIANSKLLLKKFGGRYDINEYRKKNSSHSKYNIIYPPMISIIPSIEETNYDYNNNTIANIDKEKIKKATDEYKLQRYKPLPDYKNTLESCMNLKYV